MLSPPRIFGFCSLTVLTAFAASLSLLLGCRSVPEADEQGVEWPVYGGDLGGMKYSALTEINFSVYNRCAPDVWGVHEWFSESKEKCTRSPSPCQVSVHFEEALKELYSGIP
ncbi:MAG: hypothetical protein IH951_13955 [Bacteroidetes bacterium]|nr:hypothetical protein [Bacteroidota bacterium]